MRRDQGDAVMKDEDPEVLLFIQKMHRGVADILFRDDPRYQQLDDAGKNRVAEENAERIHKIIAALSPSSAT